MKQLWHIWVLLAFFTVISSCRKGTNESSPAKTIDTVAFIHQISFTAPTQFTGITVTDDHISLIYNENVNIFLPKEGYVLSYAVHLKEDFSSSALARFTYTTVDAAGDTATDWVDDNLNNITGKTISDTTINGQAMVKINVKRPFTFVNTYADHQSAVNEQQYLSKLTTDKINFSSYVYFTQTYPATATSSPVVYQANN